MAREVGGPLLTGQVISKQTGAPLSGATVTVSAQVYTDRELSAGATTTLTTNGSGIFSAYAKPGVYTFTCSDTSAAPIESIEVLSSDQGTGGGNGTSRTVQSTAYAATVTPALPSGDLVLNVGALTGNVTLGNPTGTPVDAQRITYRLVQDGTGTRTVAVDTQFAYGTDVTASLHPTTASAKWEFTVQWNATDSKWRAIGIVRGF